MKIRGKKIEGRNSEVIPIIRPSGNIFFIAEAIPNFDQFEKLVKLPKPPEKILPGGVKQPDLQNPKYIEKLQEYSQMRSDYVIIASLSSTPDLEWEIVDLIKPDTWCKYRDELLSSGLTELEIMRLITSVSKANSLDDAMIMAARDDFLRGQALVHG